MSFSYGQGIYCEGAKRIEGEVLLGEYKLFLRGPDGELSSTFVPLDKIEKVAVKPGGVEIHIRPSLYFRYTVMIKVKGRYLKELVKDLVEQRKLKKRFLRKEWVDEDL